MDKNNYLLNENLFGIFLTTAACLLWKNWIFPLILIDYLMKIIINAFYKNENK
jgi:hypothetical protein